MNYDITFCEGENCKRKEQCHRHTDMKTIQVSTEALTEYLIESCPYLSLSAEGTKYCSKKINEQ